MSIKEQKCPRCGAAMRFDPVKGKLVCDYCDYITDVEAEDKAGKESGSAKTQAAGKESDAGITGFDFKSLISDATEPEAGDIPIYVCKSCGAEILAADEQFALTCPYCGNNVVLTDKTSGNLRPDSVIPFKITSDTLPAAVRNFYKNKKLLPRNFFSDNKMGKVTGLYVPFWVFKGTASGRLYYSGEKMGRTWRSGDYIYTDYDIYSLERDVSVEFKDLPVDASSKIEDALMDSIEPFDMSEEKPYDIGYLAGFAADRFDVAAGDIASRAEKRMCTTAGEIAQKEAGEGFSDVSWTGGKLNADLDARYVLMPVYLFDLSLGDRKFSFAVNGQTGKVVGTLPQDKNVATMYFLKHALTVLAAVIVVFVLKYLLGW